MSEVIVTERRRRWSAGDKARIVAETAAPGASVSQVARDHGIHPSQLFAWRREVRNGTKGGGDQSLVPVAVIGGGFEQSPPGTATPVSNRASTRIEIGLVTGRRLVVEDGIDDRRLRQLIRVLEGS